MNTAQKILNLFAIHAGFNMLSWNLSNYTYFKEENQVGFKVIRPNFQGVINIKECEDGFFGIAFKGEDWKDAAITYIQGEKEMVSFIDNLGKPVQGERAPQDAPMPRAAASI